MKLKDGEEVTEVTQKLIARFPMSRRQILCGRDVRPELTRPGTHHNDVARRHSHPLSPKRAPSSPSGPIRCQSLRPSSF